MQYERFGECLRRCLKENRMSASEASRLAGFRSRNSIFRILAGETSSEVNLRFLETLHAVIGEQWPVEDWIALEEALSIERVGIDRYRANRAFQRVLHEREPEIPAYTLLEIGPDGRSRERPLRDAVAETAASARAEIVITGPSDIGLSLLLASALSEAGQAGTLSVRQYIDTDQEVICRNILGILPLVSKTWYNARLIAPDSCPEEMRAIYRLSALHIHRWDEQGGQISAMLIRYDGRSFASRGETRGRSAAIEVLDRWRFQLELLKPMPSISEGPAFFAGYISQYLQMEENHFVLSVKPDVHFNCIPTALLAPKVAAGFERSGGVRGEELAELMETLGQVHEKRFRNMMEKHKPTHLVYSLPMMEQFMRTGVSSDHFYLMAPYTVKERREIIRSLMDAMLEHPYFNVHFLKKGAPPLHYEITYYGETGVLLTDAHSMYGPGIEHAEALITLPAFMESFYHYFLDEMLNHYVLSRGETLQALERLLNMEIPE